MSMLSVRLSAFLTISAVAACRAAGGGGQLRAADDIVAPNTAALGSDAAFGPQESMTMDRMRAAAFARCQGPWQKPVVVPVPMLDPPASGGPEALGMTFQEELEVHVSNVLDKEKFYLFAKPRVALNTLAVNLYLDRDNSGTYKKIQWEDVNPDYSSPKIQPPINRDDIPAAGRYLTELILGHENPAGGWPQIFDLRSSAYVRFSGFPPMNAGASFRLGAHRLWSVKLGETTATEFNDGDFTSPEDFPVVRTLFTSVKDEHSANAMVIVEGELFCGALSLDMSVAAEPSIVVDGFWYTRADYDWKRDSNTGLAAYSSMFWMDEKGTPGYDGDEAHDSDTIRVRYEDGSETVHKIVMPTAKLQVWDFGGDEPGKKVKGFALANEDRDPLHYRYFDAALGDSNFINRASYRVDVLESNVRSGARLYVHWTDGEYLDNVVGVSTLRQDIKKATSPEQFTHFKYKTTAYLEGHMACNGVIDGNHRVQIDTWGTKLVVAESGGAAEVKPAVWHMIKAASESAPRDEPLFQCTRAGTALKVWRGMAQVNADVYKIETIVP